MKPSFQFNHPNSNPHVQPSPHQQPSEVQGHYKSQLRPLGSHGLSPSELPQLCSSTDISWWERPQHPFYGRLCWLMVSHKYVTTVTHSSYWPKPNSTSSYTCIAPVGPVKKSSTLSGKLCSLMDIYHRLTCLALRHLAIVSGSWGPLRRNFCHWTSQTKTLPKYVTLYSVLPVI